MSRPSSTLGGLEYPFCHYLVLVLTLHIVIFVRGAIIDPSHHRVAAPPLCSKQSTKIISHFEVSGQSAVSQSRSVRRVCQLAVGA
eukprot:scaffold18900_cov101-Isochrysis_galbana.AAC.5